MKISDTPFFIFFKATPPILPIAPYLWEDKSEPPPLSPLTKEEGGSNYDLAFSS